MEAVFDSNLFSKKTFDDLDRDGPRVLINATSYTTGRRFVFSDETFLELRSRLNRVPISHAVMASGAFPGAFHDVTLANYTGSEARTYEHLFDGGPADNLGVTTLLEMIGHLYRGPRDQSPKGCLLIIVDAFTYQERPKHTREADTRKFFDFVFDTNVIAASDVLLTTRRIDLLRDLGIDVLARNFSPFRL